MEHRQMYTHNFIGSVVSFHRKCRLEQCLPFEPQVLLIVFINVSFLFMAAEQL